MVHQCATVCNKIDGRNDLCPTIGDRVTLAANVVVIGDITIGNNVIVGAGSVVVRMCQTMSLWQEILQK